MADSVGYILSTAGKDSDRIEYFWTDNDAADVIWGPWGSNFLVLIGQSRERGYHEAIDARTGRLLQVDVGLSPMR